MKRCLFILFLCFFGRLSGQNNYYVTISNQLARPLGMGGAFTAIKDDLPSLNFNPATFNAKVSDQEFSFQLLINPVSPFILSETVHDRNNWQHYAGSIIQGLTFSYGKVSFGLVLLNESLMQKERLKRSSWFSGDELLQGGSTTAGISLALAPRVSIGMSGELFKTTIGNKTKYVLGYQYGIYIKMKSHLDVGLSFVSLPENFKGHKVSRERLSNETLNVGIAYSPWQFLILAIDIRNVSNEEHTTVREPHFGLEITPLSSLSLRGGYFQERSGNSSASFGAGFNIDSGKNSFNLNNLYQCIRIDASIVWERDGNMLHRWFVLSSSVGI